MFANHRHWRSALWVAATLLLGACVNALAAELTTQLSGSVLDAQGKPLADVPVGILLSKEVQALRKAQPNLALVTRSDAAGKFQLLLPRSLGQATVVTSKRGLTSGQVTAELDVSQRELAPLRLSPGLTVSGRVVDEAGRPLAGAKIIADQRPSEDSTVGPVRGFSVQSQRDGTFVSTGIKAGVYRVRATLSGYGNYNHRDAAVFFEDPKSRKLEITLRAPAYLSGVVTDPSGRPLPGVRLAEFADDPLIVASADGAGRFRLGPFAEGNEPLIEMTHDGYTSQRLHFKAPQNDLQLVLSRSAVLRGRVIDAATRAPLSEFQIGFGLRRNDQNIVQDDPRPRVVTAHEGQFELKDVAAGAATFTVLARGYLPRVMKNVEIQAGEATPELLIELQRGITLRGRVIDKVTRNPVQGVRISDGNPSEVSARELLGSGHPPAVSDARGMFVLEGLRTGNLTINAESSDHSPVSRRIALAQDASIELELSRGAIIAGQVFAEDGITPMEAWMSVSGSNSYGTNTNGQGHFALEHLVAGRYRVSASTRTQIAPEQEFVVTENQQLEGIKFVLHAAPLIHGTISGLSVAELKELHVSNAPASKVPDGRWGWMPSLRQSSLEAEMEGTTYRLNPHGGGTVVLVAGPAQGPQVHKRITVPERGDVTVDFDFAGGLQVSGRVTRAGKPVAGVLMRALPDEGQPVAGFTQTTATGEYRFADLASGTYRISPTDMKPVRVQVTGRAVQDFELSASR